MTEKKNNKSGKCGVSFVAGRNKWRAYIGGVKSRIELGQFISFEEAVIARENAERKIII